MRTTDAGKRKVGREKENEEREEVGGRCEGDGWARPGEREEI